MVTNCFIDPERLATIQECMERVGMDYHAQDSEWPWNVISKRAVAYSCGMIARQGDKVEHSHDLGELELCKTLARESAGVMEGTEVGMGSEAISWFKPFFVTAIAGKQRPEGISADLIRRAFGGTIYPPTKIWIEPLNENTEWWEQVLADCRCYEGEEKENYLRLWRAMMSWFGSRREFQNTAFVMIGEDPLDEESQNGGCVFPRLAIGLTRGGSLAGIFSHVVHT